MTGTHTKFFSRKPFGIFRKITDWCSAAPLATRKECTLNKDIDKKYRHLAITALNEYLLKQEMPEESACTKKELLKAFEYSGRILRENRSEDQVHIIADAVFETCIRLARCLFFPQEAKLIVLQGKEYTLDAQSQTEALRRNMDDLKRIAEG